MKRDKATLERHLIMAAELVDRYPDLLPLLQRVEREYDSIQEQTSAVDRIRAKLGKAT